MKTIIHIKIATLSNLKLASKSTFKRKNCPYSRRQRIDCAKEGRLADGGHDPDGQRQPEEGSGSGYVFQEPEEDVGRARQEGSVEEEVAGSYGVDVLAEDGRKQDGGDEHRTVHLQMWKYGITQDFTKLSIKLISVQVEAAAAYLTVAVN